MYSPWRKEKFANKNLRFVTYSKCRLLSFFDMFQYFKALNVLEDHWYCPKFKKYMEPGT